MDREPKVNLGPYRHDDEHRYLDVRDYLDGVSLFGLGLILIGLFLLGTAFVNADRRIRDSARRRGTWHRDRVRYGDQARYGGQARYGELAEPDPPLGRGSAAGTGPVAALGHLTIRRSALLADTVLLEPVAARPADHATDWLY
jgi:hypothetical protein